jgi:hypothetical protein
MDAETADGARNYSSHMCKLLAWQRIHRGDTSRNFLRLPAVVQKQDAIGWQSFLASLAGTGVKFNIGTMNSSTVAEQGVDCLIQKLWDVAWDMHGRMYTTEQSEGWYASSYIESCTQPNPARVIRCLLIEDWYQRKIILKRI